jgi:hypothetical protein
MKLRRIAGLLATLIVGLGAGCGGGGMAEGPPPDAPDAGGDPGDWTGGTPVPGSFGWGDSGLGSSAVTLTLGPGEPTSGSVRRVTGDRTGAYGWLGPTGFERPGDPAGFWPYAERSQLPDGGRGFVSWRAVLPGYPADVVIPGTSTHVAIEYKDNLFSPRLDPRHGRLDGVSVDIGDARLGELEARRDHRWKRVVFAVPPGAARESDGTYRIRLGSGDFGANDFRGSALIHRVISARGPIPPRAPVAGFWPAVRPVATDGKLFTRTRSAYVPIIASLPHGNVDTDQLDALTLMGANTNLAVGGAEGAGRRGWAASEYRTPTTRHMGIATTMAESKARGLFAVPWNYTDTWRYFVSRVGVSQSYGGAPYEQLYDGTWRGIVQVWEAALTRLVAANPNVPFIYLKDEWDHEYDTWGSTEEQVRELRSIANRVAPGVPTVVTTMGWKPLTHLASWDLADVVASDRYPRQSRIAEVAEWSEEMRRTAGGRAFITVLALTNAYENVRGNPSEWNSVAYLRTGVYIGLVHGARGVFMFGDPAGMNDAAGRAYYASIKPLTDELRALADVLHGSAVELGRTVPTTRLGTDFYPQTYRRTGDGTSETDGVATAFRRSSSRRVLLAVNEWDERRTARLQVAGIRAGQSVTVLFENRTVTADRDGSFADTFDAFERHVYRIP